MPPDGSFGIHILQNSILAGALPPDLTGAAYDALADLLVGWGRGYPLSIPHPIYADDIFGVDSLLHSAPRMA